jgi:hypothetical protein
MTSATRLLCAIASIFVVTACASTKVLHVWKDDAYRGPLFSKVLVLGLIMEPAYRRILEDQMVRVLERAKVEAHASYHLFPDTDRIEQSAAVAEIRSRGIEAVVVTRLIDTRTEKVYTPATTEIRGYPAPHAGRGWYGHYGSSYRVMHTPGYTTEYSISTVETLIYAVTSEEPVWSAITETVETSVDAAIESYVRVLGSPLRTSGLF